MKTHHFTIGLVLALLLLGVGNSDADKTKTVRCTFSATFADGVETHIDTNNDTISGDLVQGIMNCNIGRFFFHEVAEFQAALPALVTCPAGTLREFHLQQNHGVFTEQKTGDQLFYEFATNAVTLCLNPDLTFSVSAQGTYTGGTGQFTDASGAFTTTTPGTGKYVVFGSKAGVPGGFGQITGTYTGTISLPNGRKTATKS